MNIGDLVGDYRVEAVLDDDRGNGGGRTGVYAVVHTLLGSRFALRVLTSSDSAERERFLKSARSLAQLQHPNLVRVVDRVDEPTRVGLIVDLLEGKTLDDADLQGIDPLELMIPVIDAVGAMHKAGMVHGAVWPKHLKTRPDPLNRVGLVVLDHCAGVDEEADEASAAYRSPELITKVGSVGPASDVFALGAVLYEVITSKRAFGEGAFEAMKRIIAGDVDLDALPALTGPIVAKALALEPGDRFVDANAFADALRAIRSSMITPAAKFGSASTAASTGASSSSSLSDRTPVTGRPLTSRPPLSDANPSGTVMTAVVAFSVLMLLLGGGLMALLFGAVVVVAVLEEQNNSPFDDPYYWEDNADDVAWKIRMIEDEGGHSEWDSQVSSLMTGSYDTDDSGTIDASWETNAIPCDTWWALDDGVREGWSDSIQTIYGFEPDRAWVGYAVGFAESERENAHMRMKDCGIYGTASDPTIGGLWDDTDAPVPALQPTEDVSPWEVAGRIQALPDGGSSSWDSSVKDIMVAAYDTDGSGAINTTWETAVITCDVYLALDTGVRVNWSTGIRTVYGFYEDGAWLGYLVGFDEDVQSTVDLAMHGCGVKNGELGVAEPPAKVVIYEDDSELAAAIRRLPDGGHSTWDTEVKVILVNNFDTNGSGSLDTSSEVDQIGCDVWRAMDDGVREGWSTSIRSVYGFDGGSWLGYLIGLDESIQSSTLSAFDGCLADGANLGVVPVPGDVAGSLRAIADGGSSEWDAAVKPILVGAYDVNGSGVLDTATEIDAIPCDVWRTLDGAVRTGWESSIRTIYGFDPDMIWVGYAIGIDETVRSEADTALSSCNIGD